MAEHEGGTGEGGGGGRGDEVMFCLGLLPAAKEETPGVGGSAARRGGEAVEGLGAEGEEQEEDEDTEKGARHIASIFCLWDGARAKGFVGEGLTRQPGCCKRGQGNQAVVVTLTENAAVRVAVVWLWLWCKGSQKSWEGACACL